MIMLTRLTGTVFALNSDLIERVDSTPDTVVTLVDGKKYLVQESVEEVVRAVRHYRGFLIAESARLAESEDPVPPVRAASGTAESRHLAAVTPAERHRRGEG